MKVRRKHKKGSLPVDIRREQECMNCGHRNSGKYCSICGQSFGTSAKPMKEIFSDIASIFSLDASIYKTIIPFLIQPGFLSKEFLDGKRKKYLSPIRLYLFMSILFFFIAGIYTKNRPDNPNSSIVLGPDQNSEVSSEEPSGTSKSKSREFVFQGNSSSDKITQIDSTQIDSTGVEESGKFEESALKAADNRDLFVANLMKNISYSLFLLMPVFAFLLQLFYIRRKHFYVEHLIFSVNFHSFILLILSIVVGIHLIFKEHASFSNILLLAIPVYGIAGMMRFYKQGFFKTFLKSFLIATIYSSLIFAALIGIIMLTVALF